MYGKDDVLRVLYFDFVLFMRSRRHSVSPLYVPSQFLQIIRYIVLFTRLVANGGFLFFYNAFLVNCRENYLNCY